MTDYAPLAAVMRSVLAAQPGFQCAHGPTAFAPESSTGLHSERELKHMQRGETVYRLHYVFTG